MKNLVLTLSTLALAIVLFTGCKGNSPEGVAEKWITHFTHKDYAEAKKLSTPETVLQLDQMAQLETLGSAGQMDSMKKESQSLKVDMKETKNTSDTTATVTYTVSDDPTNVKSLKMVKRDGNWKVQWSKMDDLSNGDPGGENMPMTPDPMDESDTMAMPMGQEGMSTEMPLEDSTTPIGK